LPEDDAGNARMRTKTVKEVVIVSAKRTPIGAFNGSLSAVPAHDLAACVIKDLLKDAGVDPGDVGEVILGQVLVGGQGQNPARQAAFGAGLPSATPAMGVSMVCGSGLKAVELGAGQIQLGQARVVVAGGMENMSLAVHCVHMRQGVKFGSFVLEDTLEEALTDAFNNYHMGVTAENVAREFKVSREEQDEFAAASQKKAAAAMESGWFREEMTDVTVVGRRGSSVIIDKDEFVKPDTTRETLAKLRPAFVTDGTGTVTAGNSSGINDGAAAVLLMSGAECARRGLSPMATIVATATAGVDPAVMGTGPIPAVRAALAKAGWDKDEVDMYELNEAFAAQALAVVRELGVKEETVNVAGGAIALGHPIGASGARVLVTLLHGLRRTGGRKGVAALCIGGGMGIAMCVERRD